MLAIRQVLFAWGESAVLSVPPASWCPDGVMLADGGHIGPVGTPTKFSIVSTGHTAIIQRGTYSRRCVLVDLKKKKYRLHFHY